MMNTLGKMVLAVLMGALVTWGTVKFAPVFTGGDRGEWQEVALGTVALMEIPAHCFMNSDSEEVFKIVCPTESEPYPVPEMSITLANNVLTVSRWEGLGSEYWDRAVESIHVVTPMSSAITIQIQK